MKSWKILAALFAVLLLFSASACSDDSDSGSDDASSDTTEEATDDTSEDSGDDSGGPADDVSIPDSDDLEDLPGGDCVEFAAAYGSVIAAAGLGALDADQAEEVQSQIDDLEASVPDEIQDDFDVVAEAYSEWSEAVANNPITSDEVVEASENLNSSEVTEAQDNIQAYLDTECSVGG